MTGLTFQLNELYGNWPTLTCLISERYLRPAKWLTTNSSPQYSSHASLHALLTSYKVTPLRYMKLQNLLEL